MLSYFYKLSLLCILASFSVVASEYDTVTHLLPYDASGWYGHASSLERIIPERNATVIIELGTWKGTSAIHMAKLLPENGVLYAVDHWFAPPYDKDIPYYYKNYDTDHLYQQFLSNVIHAKLTHKIIPIRSGTVEAASFFRQNNIRADLIYVDAGHDTECVYADVSTYYPLLKENGILCGDDWTWGVGMGYTEKNRPIETAVTRFANENNLDIRFAETGMWYLSQKK